MMRWIGVALLVGCGAGSPASRAGEPRPHADASGEALRETADATPDTRVSGTPSEVQALDDDIRAVIGGHFSVDHLGPDAVAALVGRLAARPTDYLDRFEALYFVRDGSNMAPIPADLRSDTLLGHLYPHASERVRALARRHVLIDGEALRDGRIDDARETIAARDHALALLADGIDVPIGPSWSDVQPDHWCLDSAPVLGAVVRVSRDCICGEPLACTAILVGTRLEVRVSMDPSSPGTCLDCYAGRASCQLPTLPASSTVTVHVGGRSVGSVQTASNAVPVVYPRCAR